MSGRGSKGSERGRRKVTTADWIRRARQSHGDRYTYRCSRYTGSQDPIDVRCPRHGVFTLKAYSHLDAGKTPGRGCPHCGRESRRETVRERYAQAFVERARTRYGDAHDYGKTIYVDDATPVSIRCIEHDHAFRRAPGRYLKGAGCPRCVKAHRAEEIRREGAAAFEAKARERHGSRFDYSAVDYRSTRQKVVIGCPEGHAFEQTPANHLAGHGCNVCAGRAVDTVRFAERARALHGKRYDYASTRYERADAPVTIVCPAHGAFRLVAADHLDGVGCPRCPATVSTRLATSRARRWLDLRGFDHRRSVRPRGARGAVGPTYAIAIPAHALLIEYLDESRYRPDRNAGAAPRLDRRRKEDRERLDWAFEHGYTFVRIPYFLQDLFDDVLGHALLGEPATGSVAGCVLRPRRWRRTGSNDH